MVQFRTTLFAASLVLAACSGGDNAPATKPVAEEHPDSAGWRYVHLAGPDLSLRYPIARVKNVYDAWTDDCSNVSAVFADQDSTQFDDALIIAAVPINFDSTAHLLGFERADEDAYIMCGDSFTQQECHLKAQWQVAQPNRGIQHSEVDTISVGSWRGFGGVVETSGYYDDVPDSVKDRYADDETMPPERAYQYGFFATSPTAKQCAVSISWRGEAVTEYSGGVGKARMDSAQLRYILNSARIGGTKQGQ